METKQSAVQQQWVKEGIKEEIKTHLRQMKMATRHCKTSGMQQRHLREVITIQVYLKKTEKSQINKQKERGKKRTKPKVSRRKAIIKIRMEINETDKKKKKKNRKGQQN